MTQLERVLDTWSYLAQQVCQLTALVETEALYQETLRLFKAVWDQVIETPDHSLSSLFVLPQGHITPRRVRAYHAQCRRYAPSHQLAKT